MHYFPYYLIQSHALIKYSNSLDSSPNTYSIFFLGKCLKQNMPKEESWKSNPNLFPEDISSKFIIRA